MPSFLSRNLSWFSWISTATGVVGLPILIEDLIEVPYWAMHASIGLVSVGPVYLSTSWLFSRWRDRNRRFEFLIESDQQRRNLEDALSDLLRKSEILRNKTEVKSLLACITGESRIKDFLTETATDLLRELSNGLRRANGGLTDVTATLIRFSAQHSANTPKGL